ncbi:MAG TPA: NAD(P)-binding domain-containing protein, partial [Phycisphaerales bacterium]|nr:NAD(P)-binding domain-containing protein [Phycisphaerales bacterium]
MKITWIGVGVMGKSMARHLMRAGHEVVLHTRTRSRADELVRDGAKWADSPKSAAEGSDIAISMVGFPDEVREVNIGTAGILNAVKPPKVIMDMSTSRPSLAVEIA